jgi:RNA polymerase sigma-70 factor, ECF subfamily
MGCFQLYWGSRVINCGRGTSYMLRRSLPQLQNQESPSVTDWDRIVSEHGPAILRLACRILGNGADAEDSVQEAFVEAYCVSQSQPVENWGGLLRHVVLHRAMDRLRRRRKTQPLCGLELAAANDPHEVAVAREQAEQLSEAIGRLPLRQASVFCLRYFEELSYADIAQSLTMEVGAVGAALHKARGKLQSILAASLQGDDHGQ